MHGLTVSRIMGNNGSVKVSFVCK